MIENLSKKINRILDVLASKEMDDNYPQQLLEEYASILNLQRAHFTSISENKVPVLQESHGEIDLDEHYYPYVDKLPWSPVRLPSPKMTLSLYYSTDELDRARKDNPFLENSWTKLGLRAMMGAVNPNGFILVGLRLNGLPDLNPRERILHRLLSKEIIDRYWSFIQACRFSSRDEFDAYYDSEYVGKPGCLLNNFGGVLKKNATLENYLNFINISHRDFMMLLNDFVSINKNLLPGERSHYSIEVKKTGGKAHILHGQEYLVQGERFYVVYMKTREMLPVPLTSREREIARLIKQGCSNQFIADAFDIKLDTVKKHVTNILRKTSSKNRTELALKDFF